MRFIVVQRLCTVCIVRTELPFSTEPAFILLNERRCGDIMYPFPVSNIMTDVGNPDLDPYSLQGLCVRELCCNVSVPEEGIRVLSITGIDNPYCIFGLGALNKPNR